jgi:hypothetical protein
MRLMAGFLAAFLALVLAQIALVSAMGYTLTIFVEEAPVH